MSHNKSPLYSNSLDSTRRLNLFNQSLPLDSNGKVNLINHIGSGDGMDWKEMLRKFNKHVKGKELTSTAALTEHTLHLLLSKAATASHFSPSISYTNSESPAQLFPPSILPVDIPLALSSLKSLESSLNNSSSHATKIEKESARIILAWGYYSIGEFERCLELLEGQEMKGLGSLETTGGCEGYDLVLRVLGCALLGYSKAHLGAPPIETIALYISANKIYNQVCSLLKATGGGSIKTDVTLHLIGEDVLFRLSLLLASSPDPPSAIPYHSAYLSLPLPPTSKSLSIYNSYRSLLLLTPPPFHNSTLISSEVMRLNKLQEGLVRSLTSLPRAGEINVVYLEFLDGVMRAWRAGGEKKEECADLIEIMYRALTHTFQSQRLLRYLIYLLTIQATSTSYTTAGKTVKLYVELWNNTRLTDAKKVVRDIRKFRMNASNSTGTTSSTTNGNIIKSIEDDKLEKRQSRDLKSTGGIELEEEDFDIDSDYDFIQTVIFGSRLFCKHLGEPKFGLELASRGKEIFDEAKDLKLGIDKILESSIERALGVALGALTQLEPNPETRFTNQSTSIKHLEKSVSLNPTSSSTLYHLCYALAEARQIDSALQIATQVVELNQKCTEGWHLLGLLVAAKNQRKDLGASLQVLETALDDDDFDIEEGVVVDVAEEENEKEKAEKDAVEGDGYEFKRSEIEVLEAEVGIRMTKNVVIEAMEGPDAALMDQASMLAYFSKAFDGLKEVVDPPKVSNAFLEVPTSNGKSSSNVSRKLSLHRGLAGPSRSRNVSSVSGLSNLTAPSPSESLISLDESPQGPTVESNSRATDVLVKLWLMSAASFRRAGKLEECRGAIQEAESLNGDDPDIWVQFALYWISNGDNEQARTSIQKCLSFSIEHIPAIIIQARLYINASPTKIPFAEGMLSTLTQTHGWNVPEAWFELSRCYKSAGRTEKERECLVEALKLENSRSIREFSVVPRLL